MGTKIILQTMFTLTAWAIWPYLSRKAGLPLAWILLFLGIGFICASFFVFTFYPKQYLSSHTGTTSVTAALLLVALAAVLNVTGMINFAEIIAPTNAFAFVCMAIVMAGVPAVNRLATPFFDSLEKVTWINMVGIVGTVVSIMLVIHKKA